MRHNLLRMVVALMLMWPGIAASTVLDSAVGTADCNGWTADVQITYSPDVFVAHLASEIVLMTADGTEVERYSEAGYVTPAPGQTVTLSYAGSWSAALDGQYRVQADFVLSDIVPDGVNETAASFTVEVTCGELELPDETVCIHPRGWWVKHLDQWPVQGLRLGSEDLDQDQLLDLMGGRIRGHITSLLARQLAAAKLNLACGTDKAIVGVVADADGYLDKYGLRSRPARRDRLPGIKLALQLLFYNLQGCPDAEKAAAVAYDEDEDALKALRTDTVEPQSFGAVKSMFR